MKTFRFIFSMCLFWALSVGFANSQNSGWIEQEWYYEGYNTPCMGIVNIDVQQRTLLNFRDNGYHIVQIFHAVMTDASGITYTADQVLNEAGNWNTDLEWFWKNAHLNIHLLFRDDKGKLVGSMHIKSHFTVNANGELTAYFDNWNDPDFKCK